MAKSIAQRLATLEKLVANFFSGKPTESPASAPRKKKAAKKKKAKAGRKAGPKRKISRRRAGTVPLPPG